MMTERSEKETESDLLTDMMPTMDDITENGPPHLRLRNLNPLDFPPLILMLEDPLTSDLEAGLIEKTTTEITIKTDLLLMALTTITEIKDTANTDLDMDLFPTLLPCLLEISGDLNNITEELIPTNLYTDTNLTMETTTLECTLNPPLITCSEEPETSLKISELTLPS